MLCMSMEMVVRRGRLLLLLLLSVVVVVMRGGRCSRWAWREVAAAAAAALVAHVRRCLHGAAGARQQRGILRLKLVEGI